MTSPSSSNGRGIEGSRIVSSGLLEQASSGIRGIRSAMVAGGRVIGFVLWVCLLGCRPDAPKAPVVEKVASAPVEVVDYWRCTEGPSVMLEAKGPLRLLVADETGLYWVELQTREKKTSSKVMHLPAKESRIIELSADNGLIRSMVIDRENLYWLSDFNLVSYSKETSKAGIMVELEDAQAFSLVDDERRLYWISGRGDKIYSIGKAGGAPQVLAMSESITAIALDGDTLYWSSAGTEANDFRDGFIGKIELTGRSKPSKILEKIGNPSNLKVAGDSLYWSTDGDFWTAAKSKGKPKKLSIEEGNLSVFMVDGQFLYGANLSDKVLWRFSRIVNERTTLATTGELYDIAIFGGRLFWTQNTKGPGGPLTATGRIDSLCP